MPPPSSAPSQDLRRVMLVANPSSGRGRGGQWLQEATRRLQSSGVATDARLTRERGQAEAWGREGGDHDEVWAFGGDGTLNEVIQGLSGGNTPLAIFPSGTGNVVAREMGIRRDFESAFAIASGNRTRSVDVGVVNGRRFLFVLSAGFDATVVDHVSRNRRETMKLWHYLPAILACRHAREPRFHVTVDGEPAGAACWVALLNTSRYAGGFRVCPGAELDGGTMELLLLRDPILPRLWRVLWRAALGRLTDVQDCQRHTVRSVRLEAVPRSELDGDPFVAGDLDVTVQAGALTLKCP